jgi:putrescine aminotransferase
MTKHDIAEELICELREHTRDDRNLHRRYVNPAFAEMLCMAGYCRRFVRAQGVELIDDEGNRYLDFVGGYGVLNLGHNHPAVRASLEAVLAAELPGFVQVDLGLLEGMAARELAESAPGDLDRVFFCNSGTEAIEAALKLARAATGRAGVVCCEGAYHGLTLGALGLNGNPALRRRFEPLLPGVTRIPFDHLGALDQALSTGKVGAFVVEPVLGEGGAIAPRRGFLPRAAELCRKHGALLVVDEVQTGLGRTGKLFAVQHDGVVPDAVALAKALGGGLMPVGALVVRTGVWDRAWGSMQHCQEHSTTFGGGPLAMAAVIATLRALRTERLTENAAQQGEYLADRLRELQGRHKAIREVRGQGLLVGVKFGDVSRGLLEKTPLKKLGAASEYLFVQHVALELIEKHRIVTQAAVNDQGVLKVTPPLLVTREQIDRFVRALDQVLEESSHASAMKHLAGKVLSTRTSGEQ